MESTSDSVIEYPTGAAKWILIGTAVSCAILELIDTTVVNVSLQEISGNIGATPTEVGAVITAYAIANVIVIPLSSMLSNLLGRKLYFTASVALFTFSSLMCGLSTSLWMLVFWRFIQGLGGGGLLSTAQSIIIGAFPPKEMRTGIAIFGLGIILGPTFGPVLGGYITDSFSWHWVFFINIPIGIMASILSWKYVTNLPNIAKVLKIDRWGILFLIVGIGSLQFVLEKGADEDWFESTEIVFFFIAAVTGIVAFVIRELSIDYPAVNLRLYKSSNLIVGNILNFVIGIIINGSVFIFPLFAQISLGWTATQTGAFMIPSSIGLSIAMIIATRIMGLGGNPKGVILAGLAMVSAFLIILSFAGPDSNADNFFWPFMLRGVGIAFMMTPILGLALAGLDSKDIPQATSLSNMLRQLGGAVGIAGINIYLTGQNALIKANLIGNISAYNSISTDRINSFSQLFQNAGFTLDDAEQAAKTMVNNLLVKQQFMLSYTHGFLALGIGVLFCVPLILMIKYKKGDKLEVVNEH